MKHSHRAKRRARVFKKFSSHNWLDVMGAPTNKDGNRLGIRGRRVLYNSLVLPALKEMGWIP